MTIGEIEFISEFFHASAADIQTLTPLKVSRSTLELWSYEFAVLRRNKSYQLRQLGDRWLEKYISNKL